MITVVRPPDSPGPPGPGSSDGTHSSPAHAPPAHAPPAHAPPPQGLAPEQRRGDVAGEVGGTTAQFHDGVVVAPMKRRHLRAVATIEAASNTHPWSRALFGGELRMPTSRHWLVARRNNQVIGFAGLLWSVDEGHITNFAVDLEHRRQHVATRMLLAQCRDAVDLGVTALTLEVRVSNRPARALYGRFGFAPGGVRRGYYNDNGEDALIMWVHDIDGTDFTARLADIESSIPVQLVREAS